MYTLLISFLLPVAQAADCAPGALCPAGNTPSVNDTTSLPSLINTTASNILTVFLVVGGALAVLYLVYAGLVYITSAGNPEKSKVARMGIINAIIGIVVILAAYLIVRLSVGIGKDVACVDKAAGTTQCD